MGIIAAEEQGTITKRSQGGAKKRSEAPTAAFGGALGGLWEVFGGPLEGPWEASGRPLGRLLMTLGLQEALRGAQEAPRGPQEVPKRRPRGTQRRPRALQGHSEGPFGVAFSREKPIKNRIRFQTAFYIHFGRKSADFGYNFH